MGSGENWGLLQAKISTQLIQLGTQIWWVRDKPLCLDTEEGLGTRVAEARSPFQCLLVKQGAGGLCQGGSCTHCQLR